MIAIKTFGDYCEEHPSRMADVYIQGFRYAGHEELANRVERASGLLALWALHKDVADLIEDPGAASMCGLIVDGVATARFFQIPIPETWKGPLFACDMVVQGSRIYKQLTTKKLWEFARDVLITVAIAIAYLGLPVTPAMLFALSIATLLCSMRVYFIKKQEELIKKSE